jgi:alpha-tubulin suppressor-like RCC1 family protein
MTIGIKKIIECINSSLSSTSTSDPPEAYLQLTGAINSINNVEVVSVSTTSNLPAAADNTGRMIYIEDSCYYKFSNGTIWTNDINSELEVALFAWGYNSQGQLGDNTQTGRSSPVNVCNGFSDWCQLAQGKGNHSLAVRSNGTAWAWGFNGQGRLGDGTTTNRSSPVSVVGGFTDWCQVSAGYSHSLGVRCNGTAWAWGSGAAGRTGLDSTTNHSSPVSIVGGFTDWCQVSAGVTSSAGVRCNGTAWGWGGNDNGRLGDETLLSRSSPVSVVGGFTDWCQISAGLDFALGVRCDGTAWGWGFNGCGKLGNGDTSQRSSPVQILGITNWRQVSAGDNASVGVTTCGLAYAWGQGAQGRLGTGNTINRSSPNLVTGGFTDWCNVYTTSASGNGATSSGIRTNGSVWVWGCGSSGQFGNETLGPVSSPVQTLGGTSWQQISMIRNHLLGIKVSKGF